MRRSALIAPAMSEHPDFIPTLERILEENRSEQNATVPSTAYFMMDLAREGEQAENFRNARLQGRFGEAGPVLDQVVVQVAAAVKPAYVEHSELGPRIREVETLREEREEQLWLD